MGEERLSDAQLRERVARLDELLDALERFPGPGAETALEAIETLTEVYGAALERIVTRADEGGVSPDVLAQDEVVGHLMVLHGLHPDPPEARIDRVLQEVRPQLGERGAIALTGIRDGVAEVDVTVAGCASTASALASDVTELVLGVAPELSGVTPRTVRPAAAPALIPAESLLRRPAT